MDYKFAEVDAKVLTFAITTLQDACKIVNPDSQKCLVNLLNKAISSLKEPLCGCAVGAVIISYMEELEPDKQHETLMERFCELLECLENASGDIKNMEKQINWQSAILKYSEVVNLIKLAAQYCAFMKNNKIYSVVDRIKIATHVIEDPRTLKQGYAESLKEICQGQKMTTALLALYEGITGKDEFGKDILSSMYEDVGGDLHIIEQLCCRLIQLFLMGLCVQMAYEMMMRGAPYAENLENTMFQKRKEEICMTLENIVSKCYDELEKNMQVDMNNLLDENVAEDNETISNAVIQSMEKRYDSFYIACLVYDIGDPWKKNAIHVEGLASKLTLLKLGKCATLLFARDDTAPVNKANAIKKTEAILANTEQGENTSKDNAQLRQRLEEENITFWALACLNNGINMKASFNKATENWYFQSNETDGITRIICLARISPEK